MLPVYFFCVAFCILAGLFLAKGESFFEDTLNLNTHFFESRGFLLGCALAALVIALLKIFLPVSKDGHAFFFIGDLLPILACLSLFCVFCFRLYELDGRSDKTAEVLAVINRQAKYIGIAAVAIGLAHLFFSTWIIF